MSNGEREVAGDHSTDDPTSQYGIYFLQQASKRLLYEKYWAFLNLLADYHHQAKTVAQVIHEGNVLLAGYPDLIAIFKDFCPNP